MTKSPSHFILPESLRCTKTFLLRNSAAWLCLSILLMGFNYGMYSRDIAKELINNVGTLLCGLVGSHLIRMSIQSAGKNASWRSIYVHAFIVGVPLCSCLMAVLGLEFHAFFIMSHFYEPEHSLVKAFFSVWFFMLILFSGWTGVYVTSLAVERSNKAELERLETETALREAELSALKAQINPHFLFNSLNTIRALVNEHPERAQEAVLHLSLLLRAALLQESVRTLREELETAGHYLALEKLRFEERLHVTIDVAPEAMDTPVPTMLIQTLVENAVKHGIANVVEGGELRVEGRVNGGRCIVRVTNPGSLKKDATEGTGLGLRNAHKRLSRLLGDSATLSLDEVGKNVMAELIIPMSKPASVL
jgi:two-component sensor histidine kinase